MITLSTPIVLPAPINETNANATLVAAHLDLHNGQARMIFALGNVVAGVFVPSTNLPGIEVDVDLNAGGVTMRGNFAGWVTPAVLADMLFVVSGLVKGAEALMVGVPIYAAANGSASGASTTVAVFPGTVA